MKTLYDKDWRLLDDGIAISDEASEVLSPIIKAYVDKGYSAREISHIVKSVVYEIELEHVLSK